MNRHERRRMKSQNPAAYIEALETENRALLTENRALLTENQRLMTTRRVELAQVSQDTKAKAIEGAEFALAEKIEPFYHAKTDLIATIAVLHIVVANPHLSPNAVRETIAGMDETLAMLNVRITKSMKALDLDPTVISGYIARAAGLIANFLTERTDREPLRELIRESGGQRVKELLDLPVNLGGRPARPTPVTDWIHGRWLDIADDCSGCTAAEVGTAILDDLAPYDKTGQRRPRADLTQTERDAFERLRKNRSGKEWSDYRHRLLNRKNST